MFSVSSRASTQLRAAVAQVTPTRRRYLATHSPLREYFVLVSDRPHADRTRAFEVDPVPTACTFSGECLEAGGPREQPKVVGNAFTCMAESVDAVREMMQVSEYNKKDIWDLSSIVISPLLTVHSSNLPPGSLLQDADEKPSSSVSKELERLVVLPDMPNVLARRVEIRPRHSPNFVRLHDYGYVSWAGPIFEEHIDADISKRPFKGSVMVVNDNDWSGFMEKVKSDIYVKERIWDMDKASFIPFRTLMRRPADH
ncbi:putative YCII-related domain-containing protein [Seiridium unicorne]|uniref:YCII-related domain-containing protein n=1 Tax=Seiridium unicorne TaxID=138068 RepID=A0ABR2UVR8_9PEZI